MKIVFTTCWFAIISNVDYVFEINEKNLTIKHHYLESRSTEKLNQYWLFLDELIRKLNSKCSFDFSCMVYDPWIDRFSWQFSDETLFKLKLMKDNNGIARIGLPDLCK